MTKEEKKVLFCSLLILLNRCLCLPLGSSDDIQKSNNEVLSMIYRVNDLLEVLDE